MGISIFNIFKKKSVEVGDKAPDFSLVSTDGESVSLSQFFGKKWVVLYFYPKDDTYACVAESKSFRDEYQEFLNLDAVIIGVSSDSKASHEQFASKYSLPFYLLSDEAGKVRQKYGVPPTLGLIPGRSTYLIDKEGIVKYVFTAQFKPKSHVRLTLEKLKSESQSQIR
jgi:peroxiredoxin Q/BCP